MLQWIGFQTGEYSQESVGVHNPVQATRQSREVQLSKDGMMHCCSLGMTGETAALILGASQPWVWVQAVFPVP